MNIIDAAHATVRNYPGGSESLAPRIGMSPAILRNKVNPNNTTHRLALDEASAIMAVSGDHQILHALAAEHGYVCMPTNSGGQTASVLALILSTQAKEGDLSRTLHDALADGTISRNELNAISAAAMAVQAAVIQLVAGCEAATIKPAASLA